MTEFDFESFWEDLKPKRPTPEDTTIRIVSGRASDLGSSLDIAFEKAAFDLAKKYQHLQGETLTTDMLADLVATGVKVFMGHWHDGLRGQNLSGLIELVLEGQSLTPTEMEGFVQALPQSLLQRISASAVGSATGIHGLLAVEFARRNGEVERYNLRPDKGRVLVEFVNRAGQHVDFYLDEEFKMLADEAP